MASAFSRLIIKQLGSNEDFASLPCLPEQFQHPSIDMKRVETSFFFFLFNLDSESPGRIVKEIS